MVAVDAIVFWIHTACPQHRNPARPRIAPRQILMQLQSGAGRPERSIPAEGARHHQKMRSPAAPNARCLANLSTVATSIVGGPELYRASITLHGDWPVFALPKSQALFRQRKWNFCSGNHNYDPCHKPYSKNGQRSTTSAGFSQPLLATSEQFSRRCERYLGS